MTEEETKKGVTGVHKVSDGGWTENSKLSKDKREVVGPGVKSAKNRGCWRREQRK